METVPAIRRLDSSSLSEVLQGRMGLIIGPGATHSVDFFCRLNDHLAGAFGVDAADNFLSTADQAIQNGADESSLRIQIRQFIATVPVRPEARELAKIRWAAVLSGCFDAGFDDTFQQSVTRSATRHPVVVLPDAFTPAPPKSTPVFKLLGSSSRDDFSCSTATYKRRASTWAMRLRPFCELVQGAPLVCVGLGEVPWILGDLFAAMSASPITTPSAIIFLADDIAAADEALLEYIGPKPAIFTASTGLHELISRAIESENAALQLPLPSGQRIQKLVTAAAPHSDLVTIVNGQLGTAIESDQKYLLADILFSPTVPRWDPFVHNLDLKRSCAGGVFAKALDLSRRPSTSGSAAVVLKGSAASGKT